jgi:creatinine amidohydrolase
MLLYEITMRDFKKGLKKTKTLIIPYGTCEAHGNHLPLGTDTLIITSALNHESSTLNAFIAPPVHYGVCTSTGTHPGTIGITPRTLRLITKDLVEDAYKKGFRNFLLISGHGGGAHVSAMKEAATALVESLPGVKMAAFSIYGVMGKELAELAETENDSHAGELETSAVLYLAPRLVKGRSKKEYPDFPQPFIVKDKIKYWSGAVWGDPSKASAQKGKALIEAMAKKVREIIKQMERL